MCYTHTMEFLSHKKIKYYPLQWHGCGEYYAKWNKSNRERQISCDFTYMWNLKNKINEQSKWKQTHRYGEQTGDCQLKGGLLGDWMKNVKGPKSTNWWL